MYQSRSDISSVSSNVLCCPLIPLPLHKAVLFVIQAVSKVCGATTDTTCVVLIARCHWQHCVLWYTCCMHTMPAGLVVPECCINFLVWVSVQE
jgi:hypothetical protein